MYGLGCMLVESRSVDVSSYYWVYMGSSPLAWLCLWSLIHLNSYKLDGSVTAQRPNVASLCASNRSTHASVERAHDRIAKAHLSVKGLKDELDEIRRGYGDQLHTIAKAAGVEHVLKSF